MNPSIYFNELDKAIDVELKNAGKLIANTELEDAYYYFLENGGKRIRPKLTILAANAAGISIEQSIHNAVAIELLHNFTLIHDDIMDASELRRGKETIHIKYDISTAVLLGDMIIGMAYQYLTGNEKVKTAFSKALFDVCYGQALDVKFNKNQNVKAEDYFQMISNKTSSLLVASVAIGANLGNDNELCNNLAIFAENLGLAFQLKDDLLDLTANQSDLGKAIGQDIIEGKKTFMILKTKELVYQNQNKSGIDLIEQFYLNNGLDKSSVTIIKDLMYDLGVIETTEKKIAEFTNIALESLNKIPSSDTKEYLIWITNYLLERKY